MVPISPIRFDAIAGYARLPVSQLFGRELAYFEVGGGAVVGMLLVDRTDGDFLGGVFARDERLRYRWASQTDFFASREDAEAALAQAMDVALQAPPEEHHQGDSNGPAVDFFTPVRDEAQLNPDFVRLRTEEVFSPARDIIEPMMRWYEDADGNFVEQFQTAGFDQRIWELYLFATLIELGYELDRSDAVPDFCARSLFGEFTLEAVTVGPTRQSGVIVPPPPIDTPEEQRAYLKEYMPIKFGSALYSKLRKEYWKRPNVAGKPFLLGIADFSSSGSMVHTRSALELYLYGIEHDGHHDENGKLVIAPRRVMEHRWGDKIIPSGFFEQPGAENVSAVFVNNSGTISKFNRMGLQGGFGSGKVLMMREGTAVDHDHNALEPQFFRAIVNSEGYTEQWVEGANIFHNPNAMHPVPEEWFPGAAHHRLLPDGQMLSTTPDFHPFGSITRQWAPVDVDAVLAEAGDRTHMMWKARRDAK
ncbi:hypothetical protein PX699_10425 [Sphingobium sp. H39-3-25]|uniref:hypothetical protein n=1 Tax=Sphingobium arseniciresistens TaxID=3030834 RepID=UPI0023B89C9F|nr:hypothetical protein [Sphingobium arseniciresistens]